MVDTWCLLFWIQFGVFAVIFCVFAINYYCDIDKKDKAIDELNARQIAQAIDIAFKEVLIKSQEEDLKIACKNITKLTNENKKLKGE